MDETNIVDKIVKNEISKKELLSWKNENNFNVLHIIAADPNPAVLKKIITNLNKNELEEKLNEKNHLGDTPVHVAAWSANLEFIKTVVKFTHHLDYTDQKSRNVAMIALKTKSKPLINYSLEHTKDINNQDDYRQSLLHYAQHFSDASIYEKILALGINPDIQNKLGKIAQSPIKQEEESILEFVALNKKKPLNVT